MTKKTDGKKPDLKLVSGKSEITKLVKSKDQPLTQKQLNFCELICDGYTKADAFRKSYDVSVTTTDKSHQRSEDQRMLALSRASMIMKHLELEATNMDNNSSSRIRALELMGKSSDVGLFVDKVEMKSENINMTAEELEDQLKDKLQKLIGNN